MFKKSLVSLVAGVLLSGCINVKDPGSFHSELFFNPSPSKDIASRNNEYLQKKIRFSENFSPEVSTNEIRTRVYERLDSLNIQDYIYKTVGDAYLRFIKSIYSESNIIHNGPKDAMSLNREQAIRAHLLLNSLKNKEFRGEIMEEIRKDILDPQVKQGYFPSEYGGLVKYIDGKLKLHPVLSMDARTKREEIDEWGNKLTRFGGGTNERYGMPPEIREEIPHLFEYHFHAVTEDCTRFRGPSCGLGGFAGDIGHLNGRIKKCGEAHSLVMTKLKGDRFNISYYTGKNGSKIIVLNLGDWKGD